MFYISKLSKATHFVDASAIYGADIRTQTEVRSFHGGRLRMLDDFGRDLLPLTSDKEFCATLDKGSCFFAGKCEHLICVIVVINSSTQLENAKNAINHNLLQVTAEQIN